MKMHLSKKLFVVLLITALSFSVALTGCGPDDNGVGDDPGDTGPKKGGTVYLALYQPPNTFVEYFSLGNQAIAPTQLIYQSLYRFEEDGTLIPDLADSHDLNSEGTEFTFYLAEDAKWHDGEPVTANDVAFTFKTLLHPDFTGSHTSDVKHLVGATAYNEGAADDVEGIEIVDEHTLKLTISEPYVPFLERIAMLSILPEHLLGDADVATLADTDFAIGDPVGSGPFKFVQYRTGEYIELERNAEYVRGEPYLDKVIIKIVSEEVAIAQLETGELDANITWYAAGVSPDYVDYLKDLDHIAMDQFAAPSFVWVVPNMDKAPFNDVNFRRALDHAIDRDGFVDAVFGGFGEPAKSPVQPNSPYYADDIPVPAYDVELAAQYLAETDYNGETITLLTSDSDERKRMAQLLEQWWEAIGVDVEIVISDFPTLLNGVTAGDFDIACMGWSVSAVDPDYTLTHTLHSVNAAPAGWNFGRYQSDTMDELLDAARYAVDQDERAQLYHDVQAEVVDQVPYFYMAYRLSNSARNTRVQNFEDHLFFRTGQSHLWWIDGSK